MHHPKNKDLVILYEIHDSVSPKKNFSKILAIELGNDASDVGSFEQCLSGFNDSINEGDRMEGGIAGDVVFNFLKIYAGGQRPADLRHRAILSFSS